MSGDRRLQPLPQIPGYAVYPGRAWLHARHEGMVSQACNEGRPWHVVAPSPDQLIEAVNHGRWQAP